MNFDFFNDNLKGNWIVQSTHYSSIQKTDLVEFLTNEVKYDSIKNMQSYKELWSPYINSKYIKNKAAIYIIQTKKNNLITEKQYLLIVNENRKNIVIIKFNDKFEFLNKFIIKDCSDKYLCMISKKRHISIIQKIYFLSSNLKIIKTIVKKHQQSCIVSFSSEIRIS